MRIEFNYDKAMRDAKRMTEAAQSLSRLSASMEDSLQELGRFWEGAHANAFRSKGESLRSEMGEGAGKLRELAEETRRIAEKLRRMEEANVLIAGTR